VLAAHAAGLTDVVLPERNRASRRRPRRGARGHVFHFAMTIDEVLGVALEPAPVRASA